MTEAIERVLVYSCGTHEVYTEVSVTYDEDGEAWLDAAAAKRWEEAHLAAKAQDTDDAYGSTRALLRDGPRSMFGQGDSRTSDGGAGASYAVDFLVQGTPHLAYG